MRIVTGNTADLVSETQTLDGSAPYAFGLDELYIRLDERNVQRFPWLSVVGGRFLNPYQTPTDLVFHKDLTFTGVAATGRLGLGDGSAEQSHLSSHSARIRCRRSNSPPQDKWLAAAQLGANLRWGEAQRLRVRPARFFDYFNVTGRLNPADEPGSYNYTAPSSCAMATRCSTSTKRRPNHDLFALASEYRSAT